MNGIPRIRICHTHIIVLSLLCLLFVQAGYGQTKRIAKGDIIEIRVYGHDELNKTAVVRSDGTLDVPLISNIPVDQLTLDELRQVLTAQIARYTGETPIVSVRFSQTINVGVTVLGQVNIPGEYIVPKNGTVQGAIMFAGGFTPRAQLNQIKVIRGEGDQKTTHLVDFNQFYLSGDPDILLSLEEGDVIVVPGVPGSYDVKIIGSVLSPGSYTIYTGANLLDVLYLAGGPSPTANIKQIRLISPMDEDSRVTRVNLPRLYESGNIHAIPQVQPGDLIHVPEKNTAWQRIMQIVRDVSAVIMPIVMILYWTTRR
jgi:protein involved in polysaccharide export with SLBB domain